MWRELYFMKPPVAWRLEGMESKIDRSILFGFAARQFAGEAIVLGPL